MKESFITAYEAVNALVPGVTTLLYAIWLCGMEVDLEGIGDGFAFCCIAYTVGLFISRCGSIAVEPLFKITKLLRFSDKYYDAERKDNKLQVLLREMNCYRTLFTEGIIIVVGSCLACAFEYSNWRRFAEVSPIIAIMGVVFGIAYIKQSKAILRRIEKGGKHGA